MASHDLYDSEDEEQLRAQLISLELDLDEARGKLVSDKTVADYDMELAELQHGLTLAAAPPSASIDRADTQPLEIKPSCETHPAEV